MGSLQVYRLSPLVCLMLLVGTPALAQDAAPGDNGDFKPNSVEVFVGGTFDDGDGEASFGLSYERRLNSAFGLGALAEYTNGREWVLAVPFNWHVTESWKLMVAPGVEFEDGDSEYLTRVGTSYEFKFSGWSLAPELNVDFVGGEVKTVVGVSVGWEFP